MHGRGKSGLPNGRRPDTSAVDVGGTGAPLTNQQDIPAMNATNQLNGIMIRSFAFGAFLGVMTAVGAPVEKLPAPLFDDLGNHHHPVTTKSRLAQRYFDQGLTLCFNFNHAEAIRSFTAVATLDPDCAMAWWGVAFAYGPNINMPMMGPAVPKA